ncbi:MAG TPA: (2Fe-2S)-binding protein [Caldimonas sp.]|nr:(2Fe-2S)-binding protein [Caldimonas sp.]
MIVCICRRVTDHQIRRAAAEGAVSLECLQLELGVAMQCGRCADCATQVLCEARASTPAGGTARHANLVEQMA